MKVTIAAIVLMSTLTLNAQTLNLAGQPSSPKGHPCLGAIGDQSLNFPVCFDAKTREVEIDPKYDIKRLFWLMFDREQNAWKQLENLTDAMDNWLAIREAAKHAQKDFSNSPRIADIKSVRINRTSDTNELHVSLTNSSGKTYSLWLSGSSDKTEGNFSVRSVSPY